MGASSLISLDDVWAMLDACAPGWTKRQTPHKYQVRANDKLYPSLPLGAHGSRKPEIQAGQVRHMVRFLDIEKCAQDRLPNIF